MKIAIFTLTRERLFYTKHCFKMLQKKAGYPFHHLVIDNGSKDGTAEWLVKKYSKIRNVDYVLLDENAGIANGCNLAYDLLKDDYDLIIKMDNDCEVLSEGLILSIADLYTILKHDGLDKLYNLSPRIEGIVNQPPRIGSATFSEYKIGLTNHIGGLFSITPIYLRSKFSFPEILPKAKGQDSYQSAKVTSLGGFCGYIENLAVNHYETTDGQKLRYPEYFTRKYKEEKNT